MERPEKAADESLEEMEQRSEEVGEHIERTRAEWERKQADSSIPGAESGGESEAQQVAGDWEGQGPNADEAGQ